MGGARRAHPVRAAAGDLSDAQHELCLGLADVLAATVAAMAASGPNGELVGAVNVAFAFRARSIRLGNGRCTARHFGRRRAARMRAHAFAVGRPVADIAADIVGRRLRLDDDHHEHLDEGAEQ